MSLSPPPPPPCKTKAQFLIRLSRQTEGERGGTRHCRPKCMHQPIAGQDPGSTASSRCSQSQAQDQHDELVLTSDLTSASSKSTDITDQASFPSTDTVITTKKIFLMAAKRNCQRACLKMSVCTTKIEVFRAGRGPFSCRRRWLSALA